MSSRPLAEAILKSSDGTLIVDHQYYTFSSVIFYVNRPVLLLNGKIQNLEYGAFAPAAPNVFIDDQRFKSLWLTSERFYVVANDTQIPRFEGLVGQEKLHKVAESGGKVVFTNQPLSGASREITNPATQSEASILTLGGAMVWAR